MLQIKVNGIELNYEEHGRGKEYFIILSHKGTVSWWHEMLTLLPPEYYVYILERRDYDESVRERNLVFSQWADDVCDFSLKLGLGKFIYVGASGCALVGFNCAIRHPEILKGLVSIVGNAIGDPLALARVDPREKRLNFTDKAEATQTSLENDFPPTTDKARLMRREKFVQIMLNRAASHDKNEPLKTHGRILPDVGTDKEMAIRLSTIAVPTLMLCGGQDSDVPAEMSFRTALAIPGAKAVFFQDEGHMLAWESPLKVVKEIELFVSTLNRL